VSDILTQPQPTAMSGMALGLNVLTVNQHTKDHIQIEESGPTKKAHLHSAQTVDTNSTGKI
jgi:hypothetical protein